MEVNSVLPAVLVCRVVHDDTPTANAPPPENVHLGNRRLLAGNGLTSLHALRQARVREVALAQAGPFEALLPVVGQVGREPMRREDRRPPLQLPHEDVVLHVLRSFEALRGVVVPSVGVAHEGLLVRQRHAPHAEHAGLQCGVVEEPEAGEVRGAFMQPPEGLRGEDAQVNPLQFFPGEGGRLVQHGADPVAADALRGLALRGHEEQALHVAPRNGEARLHAHQTRVKAHPRRAQVDQALVEEVRREH
mmetsp:Transcript_125449/g.360513  ORF Transcript_125449/g.360513 Transcript_125449/m.360513 type:complete len:248 (+) Transcript_125449:771-1514(+)